MEISNNFNWDATLTSILEMAGAEDVTATGTINEAGQLVLNVTTKDGRTTTVTMDPPEIDDASELLTEEGQQALLDKLCEICGENFTIEQVLSDPSIGKLFFDMAELMKLMQEIAQQQKKNARTERENALQTELSAIKAQADQQRNAAKYALIASCVSMVMQVAAIGVSIGISSAAAKKQSNIMSDSGLKAAQNDLKTTSKSVSDPEFASKNAIDTKNALSTEKSDVLGGKSESEMFDSLMARSDKTATELGNARKAPGQDAGKSEQVQISEDKLIEELDSACDKIDAEVASARDEVVAARKELESIKDKSSEEHSDAVIKLNKAEEKLASLEKVQQAVHAKSIATKHEFGFKDSLQSDLAKARDRMETLDRVLNMSDEWRNTEKSVRTAGIINDIMSACKGLFDALTNMVRSEAEAKATEKSAEQKEAQARYDELTDMMNTAQDVFNSVLQMYQSMLQAESQSVEQIIRA